LRRVGESASETFRSPAGLTRDWGVLRPSAPVSGAEATFRYANRSNRICVEGGGSGTLSEIKAALPDASRDLVDPANGIWLLRANLFITDGSTIVLQGTSIGGDVNEYRLNWRRFDSLVQFCGATCRGFSYKIQGAVAGLRRRFGGTSVRAIRFVATPGRARPWADAGCGQSVGRISG
jgi:hypothetical protein